MDIKLTSKSKTLSTEHTYVPEDITVTAKLQDKDVTPISTPQTVIAEPGYAGLSEVRIAGVPNCIEQIIREASNTAQSVSYDSTSGATIEYTYKVLIYKDSTTGETKTQTYPAQLSLPILPGKYISMNANSDNDALEVKVDDTALALDYFKIDKSAQIANSTSVYIPSSGITAPMYVTFGVIPNSIASRDSKGDCSFNKLNFEYIGFKDGGNEIDYFSIYTNTVGSDYGIEKTPTNTGTLTTTQLVVLQHTDQSKNLRIVYDNQVYYRMDPQGAPDGTLNYIHIDSIQDGESGYKATGKCFSVTVSTREWKVVDLNFGPAPNYHHNIRLYNSDGLSIYFVLISKQSTSFSTTIDVWNELDKLRTITGDVAQTLCHKSYQGDFAAGGIISADTDSTSQKFIVTAGNASYEEYRINTLQMQDAVI